MKSNAQFRKSVFLSKVIFCFCALFFLTLSIFPSCTSSKNQNITENEIVNKKYRQFADSATKTLEDRKFSGTVLISKEDKIIFAKGFGTSDKLDKKSSENTIHSVFETGSVTKQMTAACIMQLIQRRKLSLDDKISKYFPDYVHGNDITVRMLLNMRSGLTDHINAADDFFPKNIYRHIEKNQLARKPVDSDVVLTYFYDAPLIAKPDSTYFYCNTNYYLLAKIIEQVSGISYEDYLQKNIFNRCGMTASNVKFQETTTKGYDYRNRYYSIPAGISFGCGDVNSSVIDLYKWNRSFTEGKIVKKSTVKKMLAGEAYDWGFYRKDDMIFHGGVTNVFNSYNSYHRKDKISVIVLCNQPVSECNAASIANRLYELLTECE